MTLLFLLDLTGTFFFAVSGALVAIKRKMDLFGIIVLGCVTALGGGILCELLLGRIPPFVCRQDLYLYVAISGALLTYFFLEYFLRIHSVVLLADALGLGTFVTIGVSQALQAEITPTGAVILGTITAVAGGMMRDLLAGEIPYVLTRDFYAVTCVIGGMVHVFLTGLGCPHNLTTFFVTAFIIIMRVLAIRYHWKLPRPNP